MYHFDSDEPTLWAIKDCFIEKKQRACCRPGLKSVTDVPGRDIFREFQIEAAILEEGYVVGDWCELFLSAGGSAPGQRFAGA